MSLYNMPPGAPQPTSSLTSESPLALAPTVGDLSSADLFGSGTTNGSGNGNPNANGHGPGGHGHGSANGTGTGNDNGSGNGTVTPSSAHDQSSQSGAAATGPAVPAACLACVSNPFSIMSPFFSLLLYSVQSFFPRGLHLVPAGRGLFASILSGRVHNTGLTRTHAVSAMTA